MFIQSSECSGSVYCLILFIIPSSHRRPQEAQSHVRYLICNTILTTATLRWGQGSDDEDDEDDDNDDSDNKHDNDNDYYIRFI